MAGGMAGQGVVRHLVVAVTRRGKAALADLHQVRRGVVIRKGQRSLPLQTLKHRAGFHDQVIEGEMGRPHGDGLREVRLPVAQHLLSGREGTGHRRAAGSSSAHQRNPLNQIKTPTAQFTGPAGPLQPAGGLKQIGAAVATAEAGQHGVIKALAAEAHPVDTGGQVAGQSGPIEAGRIHLQADLGGRGQAETARQSLQQPPHLVGSEHRGGAAAQVDGGEGRPRGRTGDLPMQQLQVGGDRGRSWSAGAVGPIPQGHHREIAVEAAAVAEGDMEVGAAGGRLERRRGRATHGCGRVSRTGRVKVSRAPRGCSGSCGRQRRQAGAAVEEHLRRFVGRRAQWGRGGGGGLVRVLGHGG